jgi:hypothetical protein
MSGEASALDRIWRLGGGGGAENAAPLATALAAAAAAIARLDQALANHPLRHALLYRARLEAVRQQAATDGALIDPWHLAATIEGLRLQMDPYLRIIERGQILDAARCALALHQWLVEPDFDQEGEIQRAEAVLTAQSKNLPPLLAAAMGFREWIEQGEVRAPMRVALVRFWNRQKLLRLPVPLTGAASLRPEQDWGVENWLPAFLWAVEREAAQNLELLLALERRWFDARQALGKRRKTSSAPAAVDVLAAVPVISATALAKLLGIAVKNALKILEELCRAEIAIEVTHRSKRRLFGLAGLAPLREVVRPPYRPEPNRGPGRPRHDVFEEEAAPPPALLPLSPLETRAFDYTALEETMAQLDDVVRRARQALGAIGQGGQPGGNVPPAGGRIAAEDSEPEA